MSWGAPYFYYDQSRAGLGRYTAQGKNVNRLSYWMKLPPGWTAFNSVPWIESVPAGAASTLEVVDVETTSVASQAAVGGPSSALALAVARDWRALVLPGVVAGLLGYAVGNYLGLGVAFLVRGWS